MTDGEKRPGGSAQSGADSASPPAPRKPLSPAAERALAEAEERRKRADAEAHARSKELGGREGPDPSRYGDWENDGIASDF